MATDEGEITFEEQLALEKQEKKQQEDVESGKVKVDPDGTVYEWDADKKAWFPQINEDFIARYQMSYGTDVHTGDNQTATSEAAPATTKTTSGDVDFASIPPIPDVEDTSYADWYYKYGTITSSQEYKDWYEYYYGQSTQGAETGTIPESSDNNAEPVSSNPHDESYWEQLKEQADADAKAGITLPKTVDEESESNEQGKGKKKKEKKAKPPPKPATWFDMEEELNTNVYISGLPPSITMDGFKDLVNKCGLIVFDPLTKQPKLKLYKDADGKPKGDGLCCYIKQESIELALKILDGYVLDGHTLSVERAKFEMKGTFDPQKRKKRKLTNKEKNAFKEKQAKLFEWRPDKPRFARARHEKVVVVKNLFTLADVDSNILLVSELEEDLRTECAKYGNIKKVRIHERNPDGVASVTFDAAEQADVCRDAINGRWFACRQLSAETWDGKTKYEVEETEEEKQARLKKWELYLEGAKSEEAKLKTAPDESGASEGSVSESDKKEAS